MAIEKNWMKEDNLGRFEEGKARQEERRKEVERAPLLEGTLPGAPKPAPEAYTTRMGRPQ